MILNQNKPEFDKVIDHLKHDISSLRTGRATPAIVEDIMIDVYGMRQPVKSIASISVLDAKTLAIEPWDKSIVQALDKGLRDSNLGINPVNDGKMIRLPLPELSHERRQELIKVLNQKMEQARISLRKVREDIRTAIDKAEKDKQISEDDKFKMQDALEKIVKEYYDKVREIGEEKEKDITTV